MALSQKEKLLLQDAKEWEDICYHKYNMYASQMQDQEMAKLFQNIAEAEQRHKQIIQQFLQQG